MLWCVEGDGLLAAGGQAAPAGELLLGTLIKL